MPPMCVNPFILYPTVAGCVDIFAEAFTSDNWTDQHAANIGVDTVGTELDFDIKADGTNDASSADPQGSTVSDTEFYVRFPFEITTLTESDALFPRMYVGLSDKTSSTGASTACDSLGFRAGVRNISRSKYSVFWSDNPETMATQVTHFTRTPSVEAVFIEIKRTSATSMTVSMFSDSGYSTLLEAVVQTVDSTIVNLRYFGVWNNPSGSGSSNVLVGKIDATVEIYDGCDPDA